MILSYHTPAEISAILAVTVAGHDAVRRAWTAVPADQQLALIHAAQADLDACAWAGERATATQTSAWPRRPRGARAAWPDMVSRGADAVGIDVESDLPPGVTAWSRPGLPAAFRVAHAVQAGHHAAVLLGADGGVQGRLDNAARGVVSLSGGGQSVAVDAARADRPRLRLHPMARQMVAGFLAQTAEAL